MAPKRKYDVITIGSAVRDIFLWLKDDDVIIFDNPSGEATRRELLALEYKAKVNAERSALAFGGGAQNCAITFGRLGFKVASVVSLGCDDTAEAIANNMSHEGLSLDLVSHHSTRHK